MRLILRERQESKPDKFWKVSMLRFAWLGWLCFFMWWVLPKRNQPRHPYRRVPFQLCHLHAILSTSLFRSRPNYFSCAHLMKFWNSCWTKVLERLGTSELSTYKWILPNRCSLSNTLTTTKKRSLSSTWYPTTSSTSLNQFKTNPLFNRTQEPGF